MNKIKKVSTSFRILFQLAFIILPIISILVWVFAPTLFHYNDLNNNVSLDFIPRSVQILHPLSPTLRWFGFLISLIPLIVSELLLLFLIKLFRLYEKGEIFSINNVKYIKNIGYILLLGQLVNPIYEGLISLVLTWNNPHGQRYISISFNGINVAIILVAILTILVSWIMAEGYKLHEEQKLIV